jgi:hypothetical protein
VARAADNLDEYGELPVRVRNRLLDRVLSLLPAEQQRHLFVGTLGLTCAEKSWPVWLEKFPEESGPIDLVRDVVMAVVEQSPMPDVHRRLDELKVLIDNKLILGDDYFRACYAGSACWAAARDVVNGRWDWVTAGESEQEIYPDDWDASFYASLAVTGSTGWERSGVDHARQEFWIWYLREAVPGAFARAAQVDEGL